MKIELTVGVCADCGSMSVVVDDKEGYEADICVNCVHSTMVELNTRNRMLCNLVERACREVPTRKVSKAILEELEYVKSHMVTGEGDECGHPTEFVSPKEPNGSDGALVVHGSDEAEKE